MIDRPPRSSFSIFRRLRSLAYLSLLGLGAGQAGALPPGQSNPAPKPVLAPDKPTGSEPASAGARRAPLAELSELLEATRAKLDELNEAAAMAAASAKLRDEAEALRQDRQRLESALAQAETRQSELQRESESARAQIAELGETLEQARRESARRDEEIARLRNQLADLGQSLERAQAAREAAAAEADRSRAELAKKLDAAIDDAARAKTELAAAKDQLAQAAATAMEAERARRAATSEAEARRSDAARAREELAAAGAEIERLEGANARLEQQLAALHAESRLATEAARQNLVIMAEKLAELDAALASVRSEQPMPPVPPSAKRRPAEAESPAAAPAAPPQLPAPEDADDNDDGGPADGATPAAAIEPGSRPAALDKGLARFHADVEALNALEMSTAGADLFSGVASVSGREVRVAATAAWHSLPPLGRQSYVELLLDYWVAARGGEGPATVRVIDRSGRVLAEKSTP